MKNNNHSMPSTGHHRSINARVWALALVAVLALASCGGDGDTSSSANGNASTALAVPAALSQWAGDLGGYGTVDGPVATARFNGSSGVVIDASGNLYVADQSNNTIRKISPAGIVSTLAGTPGVSGSADGQGSLARFNGVNDVAIDVSGNLYVADQGNHTIRKITQGGLVSTVAGTAGLAGSADSPGPLFNSPSSVAVDGAGNIYVADQGNHTIRIITPGGVVSTLAGTAGVSGPADGLGGVAEFSSPTGVALDSVGNVYVADQGASTVRTITPGGQVSTLAGSYQQQAATDGQGSAARFNGPTRVVVDSSNKVYVADIGNHNIRVISSTGLVSTLAGGLVPGAVDGAGTAARFNVPSGLALDAVGNVVVAEYGNSLIRVISAGGVVSTLSGSIAQPGYLDAVGAAARFNNPAALAKDSAGNVYVADYGNHIIRKITPAGMVSTLAGTAGLSGSLDGPLVGALFSSPSGVAVDAGGNVYVADSGNLVVRKITPAGQVSTLAGSGASGFADGQGALASFGSTNFIALDSAGDLLVTDYNNHTVRKITPGGLVSTLAGTPGVSGAVDNTGPAASFNGPHGIATDGAGNAYVADEQNHTIRKITAAGVVTTVAGTAGVPGAADGFAGAATFNSPVGVVSDGAGNLYVADAGNHTVRKVVVNASGQGLVTTVVGVAGVVGFRPGSLPGLLANPVGIALVGNSLYISMANGVAAVKNLF